MAFSPGFTQTEYFDAVGSADAAGGSAYQSAEEVVSNALRALGRSNPSPSDIRLEEPRRRISRTPAEPSSDGLARRAHYVAGQWKSLSIMPQLLLAAS
jgi:hypothetical protein